MNVLIIQENGRHDGNRNFRECFCAQRAFIHHGHAATVWGLGHSNYEERPDYQSYDLIINLENYDETGWVPNLSEVQAKKFLWSIDAHVKGIECYLKTAQEGNYDLILQATPEFVGQGSTWFPNCYDDELIKPIGCEKTHDIGFCGNIVNRGQLINLLKQELNLKLDEFVIGDKMVEAINSYKIHWNANASLGMVDGKNCLTYNNVEEMLEKARFALGNEAFIASISNNGLVLAQEHTYKKRIGSLIQDLEI